MAVDEAGDRLAFRLAEAGKIELAAYGLRRVDLGDLYLPTGRILVVDPTPDMWGSSPLRRHVAPGEYPVSTFVHKNWNAWALLRISAEPVVRWEAAPIEWFIDGGDVPHYCGGCTVDSGFAGFMDAETQSLVDLLDNRAQDNDPDYEDYVFDVLLKSFGDEEAGIHCPIQGDPRNVAAFASGYGDGEYPAFWGLGATGAPVLLLCDFLVMTGETR